MFLPFPGAHSSCCVGLVSLKLTRCANLQPRVRPLLGNTTSAPPVGPWRRGTKPSGVAQVTLTSQPLRFKGNKGLGSQVSSTGLDWPVSGSCWLFSLSRILPLPHPHKERGHPAKGLQNHGTEQDCHLMEKLGMTAQLLRAHRMPPGISPASP